MIVNDAINLQRDDFRCGAVQFVAREQVNHLCTLCNRFLQWEREEILKKDPSPTQQQEHQRTLRWLLQAARLIYSLVADPDFPDQSAKHLLEGAIWQLEESWKAIYDPMPEPEANRLLAEVFPDEPRA